MTASVDAELGVVKKSGLELQRLLQAVVVLLARDRPTVETDLMELDMYFVGTPWGKVFFLDSKGSLRHY